MPSNLISPTEAFTPAAVNSDATVVAGGFGHMIRWDPASGMQDFGYLPSVPGPQSTGCSNERGTLIGGYGGPWSLWEGGFLWTPSTGLVSGFDFFTNLGLNMIGFFPAGCLAITPDGYTMAGVAAYFYDDGVHSTWEAFVATLPRCGTADFDNDGDSGTDADIEAFLNCLAGTCCELCIGPDFDGDGAMATDADVEAFRSWSGTAWCSSG